MFLGLPYSRVSRASGGSAWRLFFYWARNARSNMSLAPEPDTWLDFPFYFDINSTGIILLGKEEGLCGWRQWQHQIESKNPWFYHNALFGCLLEQSCA